jgi:hypothetical protein
MKHGSSCENVFDKVHFTVVFFMFMINWDQ